MAGKLIEIGMLKQLLRLHEQGQSIKSIARTLGISKNTVKHYLHQIEKKGLVVSEVLSESNETIELHLSGKGSKPESRLQELEALFPSISEELEKTGFTLQYLWYRYGCININFYFC